MASSVQRTGKVSKLSRVIISSQRRTSLLPLILLFIAILFTVTGELLLKHGMNRHGLFELAPDTMAASFIRLATNPYIVIGFASIFAGAIFWLSVISRVPLSYAYPMLSTSYVVVVLASSVFLGETVTLLRLA